MGPINESTRELYKRMLRKRTLQAPSVSSAAKKHKPESASPTNVPRISKPRPASTKQRRSGIGKAQKPSSGAMGRASQPAVSRPYFNPPPSNLSPPQVNPGVGAFALSVPQSPHIYPRLLPLPPSPLHSPSSPPPPSQHKGTSGSEDLVSPPSPTPSSHNSTDTGSGMVTTITNWLGARVKKIIGRLHDAASPSPRPPLHKPSVSRPSPSTPNKVSPQQPNVSRDSISIDDIDFSEKSGASPESGSVYLRVPSPQNCAHDRQSHSTPRHSNSEAGSDTCRYDWELLPGDVEICKRTDGQLWLLGRGGCGQVFKGLKDRVDDVAVKVIRLQGYVGGDYRSAIAQFKQEIDTISKLRHRHILQFYGACIQPSCLFMVTELMDTDLFSALRQGSKYTWSGEHGREVIMGTASGLHHLHSRRPPIVHRDIKSPNILVMNGLAKIADVGIANTMAATDMTAQRGYTIAWAAPEVILRKRATEKIDIWSFGIILWEVVTGSVPHPGQLVFPTQAPMHLRSLYTSCTGDNPSNRPTAADIVQALKQS